MTAALHQDWPHTSTVSRFSKKKAWTRWDEPRKRQLTELWTGNFDIPMIADVMELTPQSIYAAAKKLGLPPRSGTAKRRLKRKKRVLRGDPTGQRRKTRISDSNGPRIVLEPHDPRYRAGTTVFPTTVKPVSQVDRLLKSGHNSYKIGERLTKGRWKGMPIFTLTLEERATCPRTCREWATCYGNNMPFPHRIHDDGTLTRRLWGELAALSAANPFGFVVRLHVLGDFYSVDYVRFWREALADFPPLRIFGFTARQPADPIGYAVLELMRDEGDRFCMRVSGGGYETHCAEVVSRPEDRTGIACPAETDPNRCCATCALCMQTDRTISFVRH
jgi:hypothetical protein